MAEAKPTAEAKVIAPEKEQSPKRIRAVYGKMVDPFTKVTYELAPIDYGAPSGWVTAQLDAGKLQLVD